MFGRLARSQQERLIRRARKANEPIGHAEVARLDRGASRESTASQASTPSSAASGEFRPGLSPTSPTEREEIVVRLTRDQVRQLIVRLGGSAANESELVDTLLALLAEPAG